MQFHFMNSFIGRNNNKLKLIGVLIGVLIIAAIMHAYNMFGYPYFENDEGVYFSHAYAVLSSGKLDMYTYWYDHTPIGWILIAVWMFLTRGPFTFGFSLFSGRIFMLLIHLASSICAFFIVRKITKSNWAAGAAVIVFSLSPLGIYFQRRVLLDNIMTFWLLFTLAIMFYSKHKLWNIALSGLTLTLAILSKETGVVTVPGFLVLAYFLLHKRQKFIGMTAFILPMVLGVGYFLLYAALKGELFPGPGHVSLIGTWALQLHRDASLPAWDFGSDFSVSFLDWLNKDSVFTLFSIFATFWITFGFNKTKEVRLIGVIAFLFWAFMVRGGLVLNFYIIPLIALGSIALAISIYDISRVKFLGPLILVGFLFIWVSTIKTVQWTVDETSPQLKSLEWVKQNIPSNAIMAVDASQLLDLRLSRFPGDRAFPNAQWFWKLDDDPEIKENVIHNNPKNIQYIVLTHEYVKQAHSNAIPFIGPVIQYMQEIASWGPVSPKTYLNLPKLISTNGDWVKVVKIADKSDIQLIDSWHAYLDHFVSYDGQVHDYQSGFTTSEGQAYGMLRAATISDATWFDTIWKWTQSHLEFRKDDKLFSWKWQGNGVSGKVVDTAQATDADIDIATALLIAGKKWDEPNYTKQAKQIVADIWKEDVVKLGDGRYYLLPGTWAAYGNKITVNPSYYRLLSFRLFATIDKEHDWSKLVTDGYYFLNKASGVSSVNLPPDWIGVDKSTGALTDPGPDKSTDFGYDALRVFLRVSEDYISSGSPDALKYLQQNGAYLSTYWAQNKSLPAGFKADGQPLNSYESNAFYGALLPYYYIVDKQAYNGVQSKLMQSYSKGQWTDINNYYTQNMTWFGLAITQGKL